MDVIIVGTANDNACYVLLWLYCVVGIDLFQMGKSFN